MSDHEEHEEHEEEYVDPSDIAEEVADAGPPADDSDHDMEDIEIDLANNSWTYFDQHQDLIFVVFRHPLLPMVVTGGGDNTAYMWTTHTQPPRFVGELKGHKESVVAGGFSGDGRFVVTADMNGYVQVHRASKGGQKWTKAGELDEVDEVLWLAVHPLQPYFAFGAPDGSVWVYGFGADGVPEQVMLGFAHTLECNGGVFVDAGADELLLVTISEDGTIVCWNAFTGAVRYKLQPHDDFKGVESPWVLVLASGPVFAAGARDGQLAIVNTATGRIVTCVKTLEADDVADLSIEALAWCTNAAVHLLAVGLVLGDVLLFDSQLWRVRRTLHVDDTVTRLEFVADTPFLVASCMDGKIYKWDARTGAEAFVGVGHNMGVLDFAIDGDKVVTAGDEGVSLVFQTTQ